MRIGSAPLFNQPDGLVCLILPIRHLLRIQFPRHPGRPHEPGICDIGLNDPWLQFNATIGAGDHPAKAGFERVVPKVFHAEIQDLRAVHLIQMISDPWRHLGQVYCLFGPPIQVPNGPVYGLGLEEQ